MLPEKRSNLTARLTFEEQQIALGYHHIVGIDEAGRGTWAGPVVAGAVCLPLERADLLITLRGVRDSKQMTPRQRMRLAETIRTQARAWAVGSASSAEVDQVGIVGATRLAMRRALEAMELKPDFLLLDGFRWEEMLIPQQHLVKGDRLSLSIAAASILAKVWRDDYMAKLDATYPQYHFGAHKGYGTAAHQHALQTYGPTPEHRMSFKPLMVFQTAGQP
jgi:ribonuclease HII